MNNQSLASEVAKLASQACMVDLLYGEDNKGHTSIDPAHYSETDMHSRNIDILVNHYSSMGPQGVKYYEENVRAQAEDNTSKGKEFAANQVRKILLGGSMYKDILTDEVEAKLIMSKAKNISSFN